DVIGTNSGLGFAAVSCSTRRSSSTVISVPSSVDRVEVDPLGLDPPPAVVEDELGAVGTGAVDLHLPVGGGHDQQVGKHDSPAVAVLDHPGVRHQVTAAVALALPAGPDELDDPVAPAEPGHRGAVG